MFNFTSIPVSKGEKRWRKCLFLAAFSPFSSVKTEEGRERDCSARNCSANSHSGGNVLAKNILLCLHKHNYRLRKTVHVGINGVNIIIALLEVISEPCINNE